MMMKKNEKPNNEQKKELNAKHFWIKLWSLLKQFRPAIKKLLVLIVVLESFRLIGPYLLKLVIDLIAKFELEKVGLIIALIAGIFVANQIVSIIDYFVDKRIFKLIAGAEFSLFSNAHKKMVNLDLNYHQRENTGNKITKIQSGVDKIINLLGNFFWDVAPTIFQIILTTIVLFVVDWRFGIMILFFVPIFIFITLRVNKEIFPIRRKRFDDVEEAYGMMAQSIININTVKSFVQERREHREFNEKGKLIKEGILKEFGKILRSNIGRNLIIDLGRVFILSLGVYLVWTGGITIGSLVFVFTISEKALVSLFRISRLYDRIMESSEAVFRLHKLSLEEPKIKSPKNGIKPKNIEGTIEFKNVNFSYEESGIEALKNVNLKIGSGCVTALVGPSGGGKTTLAKMIYRHHDPDEGVIELDGTDLKKYDLYGFRKFIAIVPQEVEIFNSSIKDNISYAKPDASLEEVRAAAKIANAEEFVQNLSEKYETVVGERGMKLSGGQRQRIGIARAVLAKPRIIIFDEATSNLDSQSEKYIQEALERVSKNRTVIIVAHRLSTIKRADKIVVLEQGRIIEVGSHFELAKNSGGVYRKLINLQKMGDVD